MINLNGVKISGQLVFNGAKLQFKEGSNDKITISLHQSTINGAVFLRNIEIKGEVDFVDANITDKLELLHINGKADLNLQQTQINRLHDDETAWQGWYALDGLKYNSLVTPRDWKFHRKWVEGAADIKERFTPMPYVQLAQTFARQGLRNDAAHILFERDKAQAIFDWEYGFEDVDGVVRTTENPILTDMIYWFRRFLDLTFGHGHLPVRGVLSFIVMFQESATAERPLNS